MCGIAGVIGTDRDRCERALSPMLACQSHRGPDDEGRHTIASGSSVVALGQRRLAIIDLSPAGHQPMIDPDTGDAVVYNGELYNYLELRAELEREGHTFTGHSDTQVVLKAISHWGDGAIDRFCGMFAIAHYRAREQTLLLARDSVGIKPLYTARGNGMFLFASEVRAILNSGTVSREVDRRGLVGLLAYGAVQEPCTFFKEVRPFPAGYMQRERASDWSSGHIGSPTRFWQFPAVDKSIDRSDAIERLRHSLDVSIREHLISDVPIGVFLSSGLDSTIVAGLAARHSPSINTFTVAFEEAPDLSEGDMAARTAAAFGLPHQEIQIGAAEAEATCGEWMRSLDQPSMDGLNVYVVSGAVKRAGMTVAISGQGGDEVFGGYPSFADVPRMMRLHQRARIIPGAMHGAAAWALSRGKSSAVRAKIRDVLRTNGSLTDLYLQRRRTASTRQLRELGVDANAWGLTDQFMPPEAVDALGVDDADPIWGVSKLESMFYMGNMLLRDGDANGMAHSLEIRVPMLDRRVLDAMLPVPGSVRLPRGGHNKQLLRDAFSEFLRPELLAQGKRGFTLPVMRWMRGSMRPMCERSLESLKSLGVLRAEGIDTIWDAFLREPESPIWSRALTLCMLGVYIERNQVTA
ncbi:MAG: asparagine synthase (glutamine-hydrolyzing) [Phycisphaerales bacterium]|nr:asparagine synthase (glutamine-hydrolyzing) [Phycisphaerales bacterium]